MGMVKQAGFIGQVDQFIFAGELNDGRPLYLTHFWSLSFLFLPVHLVLNF